MLLYEDDDSQWFLEEDDDVALENDMESMTIDDIEYGYLLSIDIGVINLGLSILAYDKNTYKFKDVMGVDCLDITTFPHPEHIPRCNCKLNHTKTFTDWMEHIFQYYSNLFDNVDYIIIERQPPQGFVAVEQLIYSKFRDKCELISPNSVHKFFDITPHNYDERKLFMESRALQYINTTKVKQEFFSFERKHDMADSICMGIYWLNNKHYKYIQNATFVKNEEWLAKYAGKPYHYELGITFDEWLQQFRYIPPVPQYI